MSTERSELGASTGSSASTAQLGFGGRAPMGEAESSVVPPGSSVLSRDFLAPSVPDSLQVRQVDDENGPDEGPREPELQHPE